jgi:hypothetical protein
MIPRRTLLKLTGAALLTRPTALAAETPEGDTATITAYLDTLIPEDRLSPSASGVGIDTVIHRYIEASAQRAEFVAQGCRWLDEQARFQDADSFAAMPGEAREVIVASMASAPGDAAPGCSSNCCAPMPCDFTMPDPKAGRLSASTGRRSLTAFPISTRARLRDERSRIL